MKPAFGEIAEETDEKIKFSPPPKDRCNLVYVIFFLAGIGTLLPWNFFITAIPYFQYKLRNSSVGNTMAIDPSQMTREQVLFGNYLTLCSMLPLAICNILNLFLVKCIPSFHRYVVGSVLVFLMFLITVVLVCVELQSKIFLSITLASVVIINAGNALVQGGLLGIVSVLPSRNMRSHFEGQAVAGVVAAAANIVTIAASELPTKSALAYFTLALVFLAISIVLTLTLKKNAYFMHYWKIECTLKKTGSKASKFADEAASHQPLTAPASDVIRSGRKLWLVWSLYEVLLPGLTVAFTLLVTLSLFPALMQSIRSTVYSQSSRWGSTFFSPVVVFLSFNICDWLGRFVAGMAKWPRRSQPRLMVGLSVLRALLIPFAIFMNQQPRYHLPVAFAHDAFPICFIIVLGLTNGYLISLGMMYGPSFASPGNSEGAGVALSLYLAMGLVAGVAISAGLALLI
ncbi:unnamed protein product [Calicophoron daubneyi]|uniref:Equilibrative nucleoside transporter 1 n=1 Tax=Calicophoron daubneyi TaxID=300641 RepID=A0AAV2TQJ0_CALDB